VIVVSHDHQSIAGVRQRHIVKGIRPIDRGSIDGNVGSGQRVAQNRGEFLNEKNQIGALAAWHTLEIDVNTIGAPAAVASSTSIQSHDRQGAGM